MQGGADTPDLAAFGLTIRGALILRVREWTRTSTNCAPKADWTRSFSFAQAGYGNERQHGRDALPISCAAGRQGDPDGGGTHAGGR